MMCPRGVSHPSLVLLLLAPVLQEPASLGVPPASSMRTGPAAMAMSCDEAAGGAELIMGLAPNSFMVSDWCVRVELV